MTDILISSDPDGGTAALTTYSPLSHYGIPILRIEGDDINGDFGPADIVHSTLTAADVVAGWAIKPERTDGEIETARLFLSQWPDGPQIPNNTDLMIINGAWNITALPNMIVIERVDGSLGMFNLTPFRAIADKDIRTYKSYHPRKCKGQPLPSYLYRFYGLEKNAETATEMIHARVTPKEKEKAETAAENKGKTVSELVRDYVRSL